MSITKDFVLLLKAQKSEEVEDNYEVVLQEKGFTVKQVKTLDFNYVNLDKFKEKLLNPNNYSGLIFSSPRCVNAVTLALNGKNLPDIWKSKDNYTVGEATYNISLEKLKLKCLGMETGNANNLSKIILKEKDKYAKSFLYPHGNLKMDILKNDFSNSTVSLDEIMVYETVSDKDIGERFKVVTNEFSVLPEYMVFFSPSGIKAMENILKVLPLDAIKVIAIGPTTESAMLKCNMDVYGTAEKPNPKQLLNVLLKHKI